MTKCTHDWRVGGHNGWTFFGGVWTVREELKEIMKVVYYDGDDGYCEFPVEAQYADTLADMLNSYGVKGLPKSGVTG